MATFLLDTSLIIDALNNKRGRPALLLELLKVGHLLACCPINITEVYAGVRHKGTTLNLGDVIIAAVAIHNQLTLLTDNTKDFPMEDISLCPLPKT